MEINKPESEITHKVAQKREKIIQCTIKLWMPKKVCWFNRCCRTKRHFRSILQFIKLGRENPVFARVNLKKRDMKCNSII